MGAKQVDLTGIKFNRLHVISISESKKYGKSFKRIWKCQCDCGKITFCTTSSLTGKHTQSCGCLHNELSSVNSIKSRHKIVRRGSGYNSIFSSYKNNAKSRNIEFNLDFEYFKNLLINNCFYCNAIPANVYMRSYYNVTYNGVDRLDNNLGYIKNNVVSCCKICNISKNNYSTDVFLNWIKNLSKNYKNVKSKIKLIINDKQTTL
jgi:hypothetical protein